MDSGDGLMNNARRERDHGMCNGQGWEGSRYCVGRAWIEAIFWLGICVGEPFFAYLVLKRHFLLILKILYVCLKSLDSVSVSESPTQIFCIGTSLAVM